MFLLFFACMPDGAEEGFLPDSWTVIMIVVAVLLTSIMVLATLKNVAYADLW